MTEITLISGSTLGAAEYVTEHLAEKLQQQQITATVVHGAQLDQLPISGIWLVVCSTHGAGELPDNLQGFLQQLDEVHPDLSMVSFGAIGLGNREYDTFCGAIRTLDEKLTNLGAKRLGDRLEIDVTQHDIPEDPAEIWLSDWIKMIK
jgi:MioC protein